MKVAAPDGALAVFGLDGKLRQLAKGPDRPNNVDVEYGLELDATPTDIAVLTERLGRRLRVYAIAPDGSGVRDISAGTMPILAGAPGDQGAPMGIGLYRRPKDGAIFAIVAPKAGPRENYLWQYRLEDDGTGRVKATFVRRFGTFSGSGEIEAVAVDDELGYVYYADEAAGIHKWLADQMRQARIASWRCSPPRAIGRIARASASTHCRMARVTSFRSTNYQAKASFTSTSGKANLAARTTIQPCCCRSRAAPMEPTGST